MDHLNVALVGDKNIGKEIAKKGTQSDFTIYHLKSGERIVSILEPTLYPEKLQPLLYCINMAKFVVLVVDSIDRFFGETVVALDLVRKRNGIVVLGDGVDEAQVKGFLKGTALEGYEFIGKDAVLLREKLLAVQTAYNEGKTKVPIDHSFLVKSVGPVVLGVVERGTVKKHQELELYPKKKHIIARSLQVQDEDVEEAGCGSRVGIAVKGAEVEELERGNVLAQPGSLKSAKEFKTKAKASRVSAGISPGFYSFSLGMQYETVSVEGEIRAGEESELVIKSEREIVFEPGENALLCKPEAKARVVAALEVIG